MFSPYEYASLYPSMDLAQFPGTLVGFSSNSLQSNIILDFQTFRPEHQYRDIIGRNAHLVHQNRYRKSFTETLVLGSYPRVPM
jgi:hypothetical protein